MSSTSASASASASISIQAPPPTAVDDFLTSRTPKAPRKAPASARNKNINRNRNINKNVFTSNARSTSTRNRTRTERRAIVSPLQQPLSSSSATSSSSSKIAMSRKTLNKLKRKRLEQTSSYCHVNLVFASNRGTILCDLQSQSQPQSRASGTATATAGTATGTGTATNSNAIGSSVPTASGAVNSSTSGGASASGSATAEDSQEVMNVLRNGTLSASEMISLDTTHLIRWPILNSNAKNDDTSTGRSASTIANASNDTRSGSDLNDESHLELLSQVLSHSHSQKQTKAANTNTNTTRFSVSSTSTSLSSSSSPLSEDANSEKEGTGISAHSIASMLNAMQAGLLLRFKPKNHNHNGDPDPDLDPSEAIASTSKRTRTRTDRSGNEIGNNGVGYTFILVPDMQMQIQMHTCRLTLMCVRLNDDMNTSNNHDCNSITMDNDNDNKNIGNTRTTESNKRLKLKHSKGSGVNHDEDEDNDNDASRCGGSTDLKPVSWDELIAQYKSCLAPNKTVHPEADTSTDTRTDNDTDATVSPLAFARDKLPAAIRTLALDNDKENAASTRNRYCLDSKTKVSILYQLFRHLRPHGENDDICLTDGSTPYYALLRTKSELSKHIMTRTTRGKVEEESAPPSARNAQAEGEGEGDHDKKSLLESAHVPESEYVLAILVQVLIRLELFAMYSSADNGDDSSIKRRFLKSFSECTGCHSKQGQKRKMKNGKQIKKHKKEKRFTTKDFATEVCSIIELFSFVLPSPDLFSIFTSEKVLVPYRSALPALIENIADFFEIDLPDRDQEVSEFSDVQMIDKGPQEGKEEILERTNSPVSRWSNPAFAKPKPSNPVITPAKTTTPLKEEKVDMRVAKESETSVLFKNKKSLAVKTKHTNPLLADSKGKYVGRQFSNNYFREVKVLKPVKGALKKGNNGLSKAELNPNTSLKPNTSKDLQQKPKPQAIASLGSSSTFRKSRQKLEEKVVSKSSAASEKKSKKTLSSSTRHPHAAVMAALAAMRKKR